MQRRLLPITFAACLALATIGLVLLIVAARFQIPPRFCAVGDQTTGVPEGQQRAFEECAQRNQALNAKDVSHKRDLRGAGVTAEVAALGAAVGTVRLYSQRH